MKITLTKKVANQTVVMDRWRILKVFCRQGCGARMMLDSCAGRWYCLDCGHTTSDAFLKRETEPDRRNLGPQGG